MPKIPTLALGLLAALMLSACGDATSGRERPDDRSAQVIGLATSLPILWPESTDMSGILDRDRPPHWALGVLREFGEVRPLDNLADGTGRLSLPTTGWLVLAQPYPLSPQENVALDGWVRGGGRVLLFADPMLTQESAYPLGDRRRPQDVALLSPILKRWGLDLRFDETQTRGERDVRLDGGAIPVNLPGFFAILDGTGKCGLEAHGLIAACPIGRGQLVAVADAALLENGQASAVNARKSALRSLLARFGT